jgi:PRTRC genetic system protein C
MSLTLEKAVRVFRFNNMPLPDPDSKQTPQQVKEFYAGIYPELTNAEIEGPNAKGAEIVYEFRKAVGTKGND